MTPRARQRRTNWIASASGSGMLRRRAPAISSCCPGSIRRPRNRPGSACSICRSPIFLASMSPICRWTPLPPVPERAMPRPGPPLRPRLRPSPPGRPASTGSRRAATRAPRGAVLQEEEAGIWLGGADDQRGDLGTIATIQGGRERGLILHKLMEEVLTGETDEAAAALTERAGDLIRALGQSAVADPATGLSAKELADCVGRTLALPQIAALRLGTSARVPGLRCPVGRWHRDSDRRHRRCTDLDRRGPSRRRCRLEERCAPECGDARSLSLAGSRLSRHDRRRARTDRADDDGHGDRRLILGRGCWRPDTKTSDVITQAPRPLCTGRPLQRGGVSAAARASGG